MSNEAILERLVSSGIVAVVRKVDPNKVHHVVQAFVDGGVSSIEITMESEGAVQVIRELKERHGDNVLVGAGTLLNKDQAKEAIDAGSDFVFAPTLDKETIEYTTSQGVIMIPGVFTPTEIYQAYQWGANMVKIFPATVVGPQFFKDVNGPLGHIPKMPTGGINLENLGDFLRAGAVAAGVGGSLVNKAMIDQEDWQGLKELAKKYVDKVAEVRAEN
ncbi:2-dehydro-3-deoxyphosphogluconate aldolase / (4S)-4-hydroxy-2-oxoglutarate aldolase [Thalassobacillus cyri]|uniref:2-dehydro-3-deoxyphosphogluconate aldolase / (4S)-4-hydroxy-2-oxoglutarate aldolase n=1 Tax=Thalassobacillus cyri TaxID=571932 RepID=A0A1H4E6X3_9BACI|nr:bifunctional 4-hydroxy-2-oxoglutarate aldolase/2-dehydro-3-deoxy-phosphogluconate aldolase [Thalassobacillus cyri]SEA80092.1 2-dehydro-3-deoxyphosphogluconate aldolase / (4S)-4-hydroxy-2-oxoglutarate aldolase [Thalassobacillus cyri]